MRLWYFSSSVNSFFKRAYAAQPSSGARCLIFGWTLCLLPYVMCANNEGSGETVRMLGGWVRGWCQVVSSAGASYAFIWGKLLESHLMEETYSK